MTIAMVFPGQGSQSQGMQAELAAEFPVVQETYAVASDVLGYDLWDLVQSGPAEKLAETVVTQPAMLAAGVAAYRAWQAAGGGVPGQMAGHSLGEYTALVCADAITLPEAMGVVRRRAQLMQEAVPKGAGAMAAILGLDDDAVQKVCDEASRDGVAEAVNFNSPGQVVLAGDAEAIDRAIEGAKQAGARRAIKLPVSVPSHSSLMVGAGEALQDALAAAAFSTPAVTIFGSGFPSRFTDRFNGCIRCRR